jgi:pSer/pThr/pTyr-binding forkhead associated (FHA) protein
MKAQLTVVFGKPRNTVKMLPLGDCLIGRGDECQVRTNSPLVSRQHCLVHVTKESAVLRDLGSTNGTLVNGKRILGERILVPGDLLQIGPVVFEFCDASVESTAATSETRNDAGTKLSNGELPVVEVTEALTADSHAYQDESTRRQPA